MDCLPLAIKKQEINIFHRINKNGRKTPVFSLDYLNISVFLDILSKNICVFLDIPIYLTYKTL